MVLLYYVGCEKRYAADISNHRYLRIYFGISYGQGNKFQLTLIPTVIMSHLTLDFCFCLVLYRWKIKISIGICLDICAPTPTSKLGNQLMFFQKLVTVKISYYSDHNISALVFRVKVAIVTIFSNL